MPTADAIRRQQRISEIKAYAEKFIGTMPSVEIEDELQSYIRRRWAPAEPTIKSYIKAVMDKIPELSQSKQLKLL